MELIPRSDKARLIDLVKFKGVVEGSRKSDSSFIRYSILLMCGVKPDQVFRAYGISVKSNSGNQTQSQPKVKSFCGSLDIPLGRRSQRGSLQARKYEDVA